MAHFEVIKTTKLYNFQNHDIPTYDENIQYFSKNRFYTDIEFFSNLRAHSHWELRGRATHELSPPLVEQEIGKSYNMPHITLLILV